MNHLNLPLAPSSFQPLETEVVRNNTHTFCFHLTEIPIRFEVKY
jgi:hypothetical protein